MSKVSIIIPSRTELFLPHTVIDLLSKGSDIEVIAVLEGYWSLDSPPHIVEKYKEMYELKDKRLVLLHRGQSLGMRAAINAAAEIAQGEWLMKCDAHCMFGEAYDEILKADCEDNWIVIPRRFSLDAENWKTNPKEPIDSMHYFYPYAHPDDLGLHGRPWLHRGRERQDILIDEDVTFQGSCWFMHKNHWKRIGPMSEIGYETFQGEPQEIGLKTQLGPWNGKIMRNKKTWYAHLHKGNVYGRMYHLSQRERNRGNAYSFDFWWNNRWDGRVHDLEWLIDRFWPHPGWPDNWKELKCQQQKPS